MRFHGRKSWVCCLAHVTALICEDVLQDLKAGTAKEAKKMKTPPNPRSLTRRDRDEHVFSGEGRD
jgi:hypothetical protein